MFGSSVFRGRFEPPAVCESRAGRPASARWPIGMSEQVTRSPGRRGTCPAHSSAANECEQVLVNELGVGREYAMRRAGVRLQRRISDDLHRQQR